MEAKKISVIIPTYNRKEKLPGLRGQCACADLSEYRSVGSG